MPILTNEAILGMFRLMAKTWEKKILLVSIAGHKDWINAILYGKGDKNKGVEEVKNGDKKEVKSGS